MRHTSHKNGTDGRVRSPPAHQKTNRAGSRSCARGVIEASTDAGHTGQAQWREAGGGLGYYFARHPLKLQSDFFRYWQKDQGDNGANVFRLQLQVAL